MNILRYWHTLRHLKLIQFFSRLWLIAYKPKIKSLGTPKIRNLSAHWLGSPKKIVSLFPSKSFEFFSKRYKLSDVSWHGESCDKLWQYNLHYFDDLNAIDARSRKDDHYSLLEDWVNKNKSDSSIGWDPYPTSLRIVNWIKWSFSGNNLSKLLIQSLADQANWLTRRMEFHLLGNHLFVNAKALIFAGLFFESKESAHWLNYGSRILDQELKEQILDDGGHFERSPMYHALILEDILDILNLFRCYRASLSKNEILLEKNLKLVVPKMLDWLKATSHPDGDISFFNDATFNIASKPKEIFKYAETLGFQNEDIKSIWLKESGYLSLLNKNVFFICDFAPIGPEYIPGHAHADTLSFELSLFNQRFIVNSGISTYENNKERHRQRGTESHNTVILDSKNSSDVWHSFRVARRAYPNVKNIIFDRDSVTAECSHNGYSHLKDGPIHSRFFQLSDNKLILRDEISKSDFTAEARIHFHPNVEIKFFNKNKGCFSLPDGKDIYCTIKDGEGRVEDSTWHPEFNKSIDNKCLVINLNKLKCEFHLEWNSN